MKLTLFKNATAYLVTPGFKIDPEMLTRRPARHCGPLEARTDGFAEPCPHSTRGLVHDINGIKLLCWQTEERLLPGSVVAEVLEEKAREQEQLQGYSVGRKQLRELKERVICELLPQAFTSSKKTFAAFIGDYFVIDTASPARAEAFIEALRHALDELPLAFIQTERGIGGAMREWLLGNVPYGLTVDDSVVLEGMDETKPSITYQRTELDTDDMRERLASGFMPRKLAVTYGDRVSMHIDDSLCVTRIQLAGIANLEAAERENEAEDSQALFDGSVLIVADEVKRVYDFLIYELGGIKKPDEPDLVDEAEEADEVPL